MHLILVSASISGSMPLSTLQAIPKTARVLPVYLGAFSSSRWMSQSGIMVGSFELEGIHFHITAPCHVLVTPG